VGQPEFSRRHLQSLGGRRLGEYLGLTSLYSSPENDLIRELIPSYYTQHNSGGRQTDAPLLRRASLQLPTLQGTGRIQHPLARPRLNISYD
jgi:hypothetical protein